MKKIVVAGSRHYTDYKTVEAVIDDCICSIKNQEQLVFLSGGCRGADQLGERYAEKHGFPVEICPADWGKYGRKAGPIRNWKMAQMADIVICFWDGKSKGTKSMIDCAVRAGKHVKVQQIKTPPGWAVSFCDAGL